MAINFKNVEIPPQHGTNGTNAHEKPEPVKASVKMPGLTVEDMHGEHMLDVSSPGKKLIEKAAKEVAAAQIDHLKAPITQGTVDVKHMKFDNGSKHVISEKADVPVEFKWSPHPIEKLYTINVAGKMTINLQNYESAQVHVSLTVPATKETLEDQYEFASNWVSDKIMTAVKEAKKGIV